MNKIKWLNQITSSDYFNVGNRAFSLSYLTKINCPVVDGFVISNEITKDFFSQFNIDFNNLDIGQFDNLQKFSQAISQTIWKKNLPNTWELILKKEVNSLNSEVFILQNSLLEVDNNYHDLSHFLDNETIIIHKNELINGIKKIWANLFNAKIIFYCQKKRIGFNNIHLSIIVQPIENIFASGISINEKNLINIKASYGLIDSILKGEVLPDIYEIEKKSKKIIKQELGKKNIIYKFDINNTLELKMVSLSKTAQQKYTLNSSLLKQLINLSYNIFTDKENIKYFEWIIINVNGQNNIYINKVIDFPKNNEKKSLELIKNNQLLLQGCAASNGQALGKIQVLSGFNYHFQAIEPQKILVTKNITIDWLPVLKKAAGIITEEGGITSHAAIMARELGIPAIVGVKNATKILKTGKLILIDGGSGNIYHNVLEINNEVTLINEPSIKLINKVKYKRPITTKLLVNLSEPSLIDRAINLPIDGIGLIRSDIILLGLISDSHLSLREWLLDKNKQVLFEKWLNLVKQFAKNFAPKPIFYRSLDWININNNTLKEISPLSSLRGTLSYLLEDSLFNLELDILARLQSFGYENINLILPFVRSLEEFIFCRNLVEKKGLTQNKSFKLCIMAEVPSVIFLLPEYIKAGVQGIAIGTNDLTQLLLGVEREKTIQKSKLNANHPAILGAMKQLIKIAKNEGIYCSICGQAPVDYPELVEQLIVWGIDAISVEIGAVEKTYQAIALAEEKINNKLK